MNKPNGEALLNRARMDSKKAEENNSFNDGFKNSMREKFSNIGIKSKSTMAGGIGAAFGAYQSSDSSAEDMAINSAMYGLGAVGSFLAIRKASSLVKSTGVFTDAQKYWSGVKTKTSDFFRKPNESPEVAAAKKDINDTVASMVNQQGTI
jgi:hypothetical protein